MSSELDFTFNYELAKKDKLLRKKQIINILLSAVLSLLIVARNYTIGFVLVFSFSYWQQGFDLMSSIKRDMFFIILWSLAFGLSIGAIEIVLFNLAGFKNVFKSHANEITAIEKIKNDLKNEIYPNLKEYVPWYINKVMQEKQQ
jgi:hypothetical protein